MIVIYLSLHSPYEYNVTIPRTTLSSSPPPPPPPPFPKRGKRIPFRIRVKPYALKY